MNKRTLALRVLQWSLPRLDRALETLPDFPIAERGRRGVAWCFDAPKVLAYVKATGIATIGTLGSPVETQRLRAAQAELVENRVGLANGRLIPRAFVVDKIGNAFGHLGKSLDNLPGQLARQFHLPAETVAEMRRFIDNFRREVVRNLQECIEVVDKPTAKPRRHQ